MSKRAKRERQRLNREARREAEIAAARRRRRLKTVRNVLIVLLPVAIVFAVIQIRSDDGDAEPEDEYAVLTTDLGEIVIELDPEQAPTTVERFVELVNGGFYSNLTFHRASTATGVVQAGDPNSDGTPGPNPPETIEGELPEGPYAIGDVAMAKTDTDSPGAASSQFFIITSSAGTELPPEFSRFGRVIGGLDVAQQIETLAPPEGDGPPTQPVTILQAVITGTNPVAPTTTAPATTAPASLPPEAVPPEPAPPAS